MFDEVGGVVHRWFYSIVLPATDPSTVPNKGVQFGYLDEEGEQ